MPLFFWTVIGAAVVVLLVLIMILASEIRNNRRFRDQQIRMETAKKEKAEAPKPSRKKQPPERKRPPEPAPAAAVKTEPVPEAPAPALPEEIAPIIEEAIPYEPETLAVEIPAPETAEEAPAPVEEIPAPETAEEVPAPVEEVPAVEVEAEVPAEAPFEPSPYPEFNNARAVEQLGLSQEEADMFVTELVEQIEAEMPNLESAIAENDINKVERVSHMLKGSATSLGTGGVADVLVDFNTYCKTGSDLQVIQRHMNNLTFYFGQLKSQFGA